MPELADPCHDHRNVVLVGGFDDFLVPHLIRVAETRAKARAFRDAVNVGVVSFEELDGASLPSGPSSPGSGAAPAGATRSPRHSGSGPTPARPRATASRPRAAASTAGNGTEPMSEAQRRYLFRILAGQGLQKEAAEEHLKDLFQVGSLSEITKLSATKMIDELLQASAPERGGGNGAAARSQR